MTAISPNKYGILIGAKAALLGDANVKLFTSQIEIVPRDINFAPFKIGRNRLILLRDGGATRSEESMSSCVWEVTLHIAIIDIGGDINMTSVLSRIIAARQDVCEVLDYNTGIYADTNEWIEEAHVTDIPETVKPWADAFENNESPFTMEPVMIKYKLFHRER